MPLTITLCLDFCAAVAVAADDDDDSPPPWVGGGGGETMPALGDVGVGTPPSCVCMNDDDGDQSDKREYNNPPI
jgi:hypothetical protein